MAPAPGADSIRLRGEELDAARQLLGLAVGLGPSGVLCLKHLLESLMLFATGRALVFALERIGLSAAAQEQIHLVSHWYELGVFLMFTLFCGVQLLLTRIRELRETIR